MVLLFGLEHVILASKMCVGFAKYFVTLVDRATDGNWQGKGAFVFYLELCADLVHLSCTWCFFHHIGVLRVTDTFVEGRVRDD